MKKQILIVLVILAIAAIACGSSGQQAPPQVIPAPASPTPPPIPTDIPVTPTPIEAGEVGGGGEPEPEEAESIIAPAIFVYGSTRDGRLGIYFLTADASVAAPLPLPAEVPHAVWPAVSPDGTRIAFVSVRGSADLRPNGIFISNLDGSNALQITFGDGTHPTWSPTGGGIAFSCEGGTDICIANVDGSAVVNLTEDIEGFSRYPSWTPDGRIVFMSSRDVQDDLNLYSEIYIMDSDGSNVTRLTEDETAYNSNPQVSPDGNLIIYESDKDVPGSTELYVMSTNGEGSRRLTQDTFQNQNAVWSPDSARIMYSADTGNGNRDLFFARVDDANAISRLTVNPYEDGGLRLGHDWMSGPVNVAGFVPEGREITLNLPEGVAEPVTNAILFAANEFNCTDCLETGIYRINFDGANLSQLIDFGEYPAWAPDYTRFAFTFDGELYMANADGTEVTQLTSAYFGLTAPVWRGDGTSILIDCVPYGQHDVCLVDPETGQISNLTDQITLGTGIPYPSWYLDRILVGSQLLALDGVLVESLPAAGRVSPNGRQLATVTADRQIASVALDVDETTTLTSDGTSKGFPIWSPNSDLIIYTVASGDGRQYLAVMRADGTNQEIITPAFAAGPTDATAPIDLYLGYSWGN